MVVVVRVVEVLVVVARAAGAMVEVMAEATEREAMAAKAVTEALTAEVESIPGVDVAVMAAAGIQEGTSERAESWVVVGSSPE